MRNRHLHAQAHRRHAGEREPDTEVVVLAERGGETRREDVPVVPCFSRGTDFSRELVKEVHRAKADVVHFQHAPDIFGMGSALIDTMSGLRHVGLPVAITMHTVFTRTSGLIERKPFAAGFHRRLAASSDSIIVHSKGSGDILVSHKVPRHKIATIAHGTDLPEPGDPAKGREVLGLGPDDKAILFFGFIHVQKNIQVVVKALPRIVEQVPEAKLVIAGKVGGDAWYNRMYLNSLRRKIRSLKMDDRAAIVDGFIPDENIPDIHAAARVMVMPHAQGYGSASGVVHNAMAMGLPMVCSDSIKFEEVASNISKELLVPAHKPRRWAEMIVRMLRDDDFYEDMKRRGTSYAEETLWPVVAGQHLDLYRELAGDKA